MSSRRTASRSAIAAEKEPGLDLSSLIDVSFLLLIYFLVTMTLQVPDADLKMTIPPGGGGFSSIDTPRIDIDEAGQIFLTEELLESADSRKLPVLTDRLKTYVAAWKMAPKGKSPDIIVKAHDSAKGQRFIDVLNCLAEVGISNVAFAKDE